VNGIQEFTGGERGRAFLRQEARAVERSRIIEVDGKVEAFTLGELLNRETVVIHVEKANAAFHGLYQVIDQQFLEQTWQHARYVNPKQDLGLPGLRKAKESYHPDHLVEKFAVTLR